ncbi:hypothetical protein Esi_0050_0072 [Ectocarpus siliculosus]|uniref:Uncharacterized protein n=1 Tax=Ectocarpus siliculosus TaxID=2880 RepID=D7G377_ECTSI|nr:hypothetical protein Esi_0050_0072 [Ectocarpus siliculosus]|eukprot:CBJ26924.1 hypothetical protein Esi_0050_0072 [Ectocarpus siliculosus]
MSVENARSFASRHRDILSAVSAADVNLACGAGDAPPAPTPSPPSREPSADNADRTDATRGIVDMSAFLDALDNPLLLRNIGIGRDSNDNDQPPSASSSCPSVP